MVVFGFGGLKQTGFTQLNGFANLRRTKISDLPKE